MPGRQGFKAFRLRAEGLAGGPRPVRAVSCGSGGGKENGQTQPTIRVNPEPAELAPGWSEWLPGRARLSQGIDGAVAVCMLIVALPLLLLLTGVIVARRISKRLSELEAATAARTRHQTDWRNLHEIPVRLVTAKVIRKKRRDALIQLPGGQQEWMQASYWGMSAAYRAGAEPVPPVGASLDVMIHGRCPWKRDNGLRVDVHEWVKDTKFCTYQSGYRSSYDAEAGLFATPPWEKAEEMR